MLIAAAVCPYPPLLVPEVAGGAAHELDALRSACDDAIRQLLACGPHLVLVVGPDPQAADGQPRRFAQGAGGSLAPYGVDVRVALGADGSGPVVLPLSLTLGAWVLARGGWQGRVGAWSVPDLDAERCAALGAGLADEAERVGMLVLGDGSARRSEKAPGHVDPRAEPFDRQVSTALASGDPNLLLAVEAGPAAELMAAGRPAWQVLAGAAAASGRPLEARLLYDDAPYGVGYLVATWVSREGPEAAR